MIRQENFIIILCYCYIIWYHILFFLPIKYFRWLYAYFYNFVTITKKRTVSIVLLIWQILCFDTYIIIQNVIIKEIWFLYFISLEFTYRLFQVIRIIALSVFGTQKRNGVVIEFFSIQPKICFQSVHQCVFN